MKPYFYLTILLLSCGTEPKQQASFEPEAFLSEFVSAGQLAHGGILSPDGLQYYVTLSDSNFQHFNVVMSENKNGKWGVPKPVSFNSSHDEHGVNFSPDQQYIYFSSTRPVPKDSLSNSWQIWRCQKTPDGWGEPEWVILPSMSGQLVSHPSLTETGRIYFHAGKKDYSQLSIYYANQHNGKFSAPKKVTFNTILEGLQITPYVAADESFLIFGQLANGKEELYVSKNINGEWQTPIRLNDKINHDCKANPFISTDAKFLYYASGKFDDHGIPKNWIIKRVLWKGMPDSIRFSKN
ncbi:TolB family protein [Reichenbachiella sp.]|uniref:TolB family protein n=1 Tax=Reichenbachiella sp. TaxID=2184521 RepID=UPI003B58DAFC